MPTISINIPLGRIAIGHTAQPGLHLQQDEATGLWVIASHIPKTTRWTRFLQTVQSYRSSKWMLACSAGVAGVVFAFAASQISGAWLLRKNPVVALQAAPLSTTSIAVAQVAYSSVQALPLQTGVLPLPIQTALPDHQTPNLPESFATGMPSPALPLSQEFKQPAPSTKKPVKDDAPMSVFNEPLQSKLAPVPTTAVVIAPQASARTPPVSLTPTRSEAPAKNAPQTFPVSVGNENRAEAQRSSASLPLSILAVHSQDSIVVTNPTTRLPMVVKVGDPLPDGSLLKSVDKTTSSATTSRGETLSLR